MLMCYALGFAARPNTGLPCPPPFGIASRSSRFQLLRTRLSRCPYCGKANCVSPGTIAKPFVLGGVPNMNRCLDLANSSAI